VCVNVCEREFVVYWYSFLCVRERESVSVCVLACVLLRREGAYVSVRERESAIVLVIMRERECNSSNNNERERVQ